MPDYTTNFNLEKPLPNEYFDINTQNKNMDTIDTEIAKKASSTEDGRMSKEDKQKLDGIEDGAINYIHPSFHPANMITQDNIHRFVSDAQIASWDGRVEQADLDLLAGVGRTTETVKKNADDIGTLNAQTADLAINKVDKVTGKGLSTEDFTTTLLSKLNGIEAGATNYQHPSTHPATMITEDSNHRFATDTEKTTWNGKQSAITGAATTITGSNLTASRALVSDTSGKVGVSTITATELSYLDNCTGNIQSQLDLKLEHESAVIPGDYWIFQDVNQYESSSISTSVLTSYKTTFNGRVRISFEGRTYSKNGDISEARVYIDGVAVGVLRTNTSYEYTTYVQDFDVAVNSLVEIRGRYVSGDGSTKQIQVQNIKFGVSPSGRQILSVYR